MSASGSPAGGAGAAGAAARPVYYTRADVAKHNSRKVTSRQLILRVQQLCLNMLSKSLNASAVVGGSQSVSTLVARYGDAPWPLSLQDCWVVIHNVVIDFTPLIPGAPADLVDPVLAYAGQDLSHWFNKGADGQAEVSNQFVTEKISRLLKLRLLLV